MRICFLGAGSTVFAKNILGDCIFTPELGNFEIALHDINEKRLNESYNIITAVNAKYNGKAKITKHLNRREALTGANYIINAIQVGGYKPCTVIDFKIPKRYGLRQTIGDTLGIGGIMRALRTIPVLEDFAKDIEEVCPDALFLNYSNPMAMLTGYLLTYTKVKAVGLCHSVQTCVPELLKSLSLKDKLEGAEWDIYGINHQAWLVNISDKEGQDLYPLIKQRSKEIGKVYLRKFVPDMVRHELMRTFGYYVTESSEHNAEYTPYFIKSNYKWLIRQYGIPLDEYPRRCRLQIAGWRARKIQLKFKNAISHNKSHEYGSYIIKAAFTGEPFRFNGSVLNTTGIIPNLPREACIEVPIIVDDRGFHPIPQKALPEQLAALNRTNINPQLMTLKAAKERRLDYVFQAAALDPHTSAELSLGDIKAMCIDLYNAHRKAGNYIPTFSMGDSR